MKIIAKKDMCARLILLSAYLLIGLPLYSSNKFLDYIKIIGSINMFHIFLGLAVIYIVLSALRSKNGLKIRKPDIFVIIFTIIVIIQVVVGLEKKYNVTMLLRDCNYYILPIMVYISFRWLFEKYRIDTYILLNFILYAQSFCVFLNLIMYITRSWSFWGISSYANGRYGGSYMGAFIFISGYATYLLINHINIISRKYLYIYLVVGFIGILLGQSRSLLFFSICSIALSLIISTWEKGKLRKNRFIVVFLCLIVGSLMFLVFLNSDAQIVNRLSSFSNIQSDSSFLIRVGIFTRNISLTKQKPFGLGLGYEFSIYDSAGNRWGDVTTTFVDCSYLTIGVKLGVIAMVLYFILTVIPIIILRKSYQKKVDKIFTCICISYLLCLINSTLLSAQSLNAYALSTIIWILIAYVVTYRINTENMNNKNIYQHMVISKDRKEHIV